MKTPTKEVKNHSPYGISNPFYEDTTQQLKDEIGKLKKKLEIIMKYPEAQGNFESAKRIIEVKDRVRKEGKKEALEDVESFINKLTQKEYDEWDEVINMSDDEKQNAKSIIYNFREKIITEINKRLNEL